MEPPLLVSVALVATGGGFGSGSGQPVDLVLKPLVVEEVVEIMKTKQ